MLKFLERHNFFDTLKTFVKTTPTFGTCAGAILLAKDVENPVQKSLDALDITVERNAYGRQVDSTILTAPQTRRGAPRDGLHPRPSHCPNRPRSRNPRHP